jgi:signal transduction histidine kinase
MTTTAAAAPGRPNELETRSAMEARLWTALSAVGVARCTRGLDGSFESPQPSWSLLTGQSEAELAGYGWLDAVHPEDREEVRLHWSHGQARPLAYRLGDATGAWLDVVERCARFDGADGLPPQVIGVIEEVGELRRAEQRLRLALDGGKMGTWDIDLSTGAMACSGQCKMNYGRSPGDSFTYEDLAASVHPEDVERWRAVVAQAIERGGDFGIDYRAVWPDGSIHWVFARGSCSLDDQGKAATLSGVSIDVTDRKRAERLEQERASKADRESQRKSEFLAILAHELRGPLAPIRGALQALRSRGDDAKDREWLRALAERQVKHLALLVEDLLDVARIERGEIRLRIERFDLREALQVAIETCAPLMEARGQRFETVGFGHPIMALGDPTRIAQMASNLLNNAAKYTPSRGCIRLELSRASNQVEICVADDGVGLEPEALERVFDMFAQIDDHKAQAQGGLGIGLALTRQLAELHGGSVSARSEGIGRGCRFSIALPLDDA